LKRSFILTDLPSLIQEGVSMSIFVMSVCYFYLPTIPVLTFGISLPS
jgi:hypothetical protein